MPSSEHQERSFPGFSTETDGALRTIAGLGRRLVTKPWYPVESRTISAERQFATRNVQEFFGQ
jgi:hypothetical protein